jgi:UDP-N-acetylglucosamine--N-acetylmuramyl-(pentapeptide) pyrophosphoryl-undecaprenol N-acetylglucosamine transferase
MRVLVMAGGTGGHIFPALAVAKRLIQQGHTVRWLGTKNSMEAGITQANEIPISYVSISGIRGKGVKTKLLAPMRLAWAFTQSLKVMLSFKPEVVLGMGGYVTGPAGIAAWVTRRRLIIHEQNAIAGMTNQILARFSHKVLEAFPNSFPQSITANLTGNPVREDFHKLLAPEKRSGKNTSPALKILILGGSGGAQSLNNIIPQILSTWGDKPKPMVWHQAGAKHIANAKQAYSVAGINVEINSVVNAGINIKLVDFIQDMPNAYAWADIVICRAGALTIAEIAAAGVASILIPYPYAVDDHQTKNADYLVASGAALMIQERDLNVEKLRDLLQDLAANPAKILAMAKAAHKLAKPESLDKVVEFCLQA